MATPKRKRRTLREAEEEIHAIRKTYAEARRKLVLTARENAKMKVLLMKYIEKDDSLLSSSQLSTCESHGVSSQRSVVEAPPTPLPVVLPTVDGSFSPKESTTMDEATESEGSLWTDELAHDEDGPGLSQISQLSHVSHWSELSSTSNLDEIINFLEKQDTSDADRMTCLEQENLELKNAKTCVRVGVGVLLTSVEHPRCVLIGKRKGAHGEGKYALPGGHLELYESWAECAKREVKEETDLDIDEAVVKFAYVTNDPMEDEGKHYITIFVHAQVSSGQVPRNMEPHKCEGWIWEPWNSLRSRTNLFSPLLRLTRSPYELPTSSS